MSLNKLREAFQVMKRECRRLVGSEHTFRSEVSLHTVKIGNPGANWEFAPEFIDGESVVYSFGIGREISFDVGLISMVGCTVHAFDPTPRSLEWLSGQALPPRFVVHSYGLAALGGEMTFIEPKDASHVSFRPAPSHGGHEGGKPCPVHSLDEIMGNLGHSNVDLLKMDIEGAEYDVMRKFSHNETPVKQMLVEFHHRMEGYSVEDTENAVRHMKTQGYLLVSVSPNGQEIGFIHRSVLTR